MRRFTLLSERLASDDAVQALLSDYIGNLAAAAVAHGGTVHEVAGDGLARPLPHRRRASPRGAGGVRLADAFDRMIATWAERAGFDLEFVDVGFGIATGVVILGTVGNDRFRDFTVIGNAINLAAMLVEAAEGADRVVCDLMTYAALSREAWLAADDPRKVWPKHDIRRESRPHGVYALGRRN